MHRALTTGGCATGELQKLIKTVKNVSEFWPRRFLQSD